MNKTVFLIFLVLTTVSAYAGELDGVCAEKNTAQACKVVNETDKTITQINWLLEGSDVDYGDEALVNLEPGDETVIANEGEDNCLFTGLTWITAYTKDDDVLDFGFDGIKAPYINFDKKDNCTITLK